MKKSQCFILLYLIAIIIYSCTSNRANTIQIKPQTDTIKINVFQKKIDSLENVINEQSELLNSIIIINDSLKNKLIIKDDSINYYKEQDIVSKYKLNRIKYYNNIAAKSNNIKYLRGWINRTLNE